MSFQNLPDNIDSIGNTGGKTVAELLIYIASEELELSNLINKEADKIGASLKTLKKQLNIGSYQSARYFTDVNGALNLLLDDIANTELHLNSKIEGINKAFPHSAPSDPSASEEASGIAGEIEI